MKNSSDTFFLLQVFGGASKAENIERFAPLFVDNGAAPKAILMLANGAIANGIQQGQTPLDVRFQWEIPQAVSDATTREKENTLQRISVEFLDANDNKIGQFTLGWTPINGGPIVQSLSNGALNNFLRGLGLGTYSWRLRGAWDETSGVFEGSKMTFTVN